jgi:hypothetical protein
MSQSRREELLRLLSHIDQQIAAAERETVEAPDDNTLLQASAVLRELREALAKAERQIRREEELS